MSKVTITNEEVPVILEISDNKKMNMGDKYFL